MNTSRFKTTTKSLALLLAMFISACSIEPDKKQNVVAQSGKNSAAVRTSPISPGDATCANGGITVESGIDDNANGVLDSNEIDATQKVCNGATGAQGNAGNNGLNSLVALTTESAGTNCQISGVKIQSGVDLNSNNVLDTAEVNDTKFVCSSAATNTTNTTSPTSNFVQSVYDSLGATDVTKGGLLYDKWWTVSSTSAEPAVGNNHPLWPTSNTSIQNSTTWRCQECHGWDYRGKDGVYSNGEHYTGFTGIVSTPVTTMSMATANNVYSYLKSTATHGFANGFFTDDEYYDLTKFIMTMREEALANTASFNFVTDDKQASGASITNGKSLFEGVATCSICHGTDGKKMDFADRNISTEPNIFVHSIAQDNPWEFLHKIRFGMPGTAMSGLYSQNSAANIIQAAVDILGYAQTLLIPSVQRAGLLYDEWWSTAGVKVSLAPASRNPIWAANTSATQDTAKITNEATWRCQQCHGWDYQGVSGAFSNTTLNDYSGTAGLFAAKSKTKQQLVDAIGNGDCTGCDSIGHTYSLFLSSEDIELLATFIQNLATSTDYNAALASTDTTTGKTLYQSNTPGHCENCHGSDGKSIPVADLSATANNNPQKFIHTVRYGHPGSAMVPPNQGFLGLTLGEAGNVLAYGKTLGTAANSTQSYENANLTRGGRLFDKWWVEKKATNINVQIPLGINPFYQLAQNNGNLPALATGKESDSWRCVTCHAWNYKGVGYTSGVPSDSGADNLLYKVNLRRQTFSNNEALVREHFFTWIKTGYNEATTHKYGVTTTENTTPLNDQDVWDIIKFLLEGGLIDSSANILSSGVAINSDMTNGAGLYNGSITNSINCSVCHGIDGNVPPPSTLGGSGLALDIFSIAAASNNPWEFVHKIRFGQPGTAMPGTTGIPSLITKDAYDILGYAQQRYNARTTP